MPTRSEMLIVDEVKDGSNIFALNVEPRAAAQQAFALITSELEAVEREFARQAESDVQLVARIGRYLHESGGKRVRPALLLLANYASGGDGSRASVIRMATVMEFLHTATLVHDDIIDNSETRRGELSINARYGNQISVLVGDWLYMSAFEISLAERSLAVLDILTNVTRKMVEGELMQLTELGSTDTSETTYFEILERKTAYLFSACCEIGALVVSKDKVTEAQLALRDYGMNLGRAFQLVDDLLDFTCTDEDLGKPAGADLLEGKITLPILYLLQSEPARRAEVQAVMRAGNYTPISRYELIRAAQNCGAIEHARQRAMQAAEDARKALDLLPASDYKNALALIPSFILNRES